MAEEKKKKHALWMPEGSVRALLALIAVVGGVVSLFVGIKVPEWLIAVISGAIAYYFGAHKPIGEAKNNT